MSAAASAPAAASARPASPCGSAGSAAMSMSSAGSSSDSSGGAEEVQVREGRWACCWCFVRFAERGVGNDVGFFCVCGHLQCRSCLGYARVANWVIGLPRGGAIGDEGEEMEEAEEEEEEEDEEEEEEGEGEGEGEEEAGEKALP